jgi:hypothetical protein
MSEFPRHLNDNLERRHDQQGKELEYAVRVATDIGLTESWEVESVHTNLRIDRLETEAIMLKTRTKELETKFVQIDNRMIQMHKQCSVRDATLARLKDTQIKKDRKEVENILVLRGWWDAANWILLAEDVRNTTIQAICDKAGVDITEIKIMHTLPSKTKVSEWSRLTFSALEDKRRFKTAINESNKPTWSQEGSQWTKEKPTGMAALYADNSPVAGTRIFWEDYMTEWDRIVRIPMS